MWCPEGQYTFTAAARDFDVYVGELLQRFAMRTYPQKIAEIGALKPRGAHAVLVASGACADYREARLTQALTVALVLSEFMEHFPPRLIAADGPPIAVEEIFFEHMDELHFCCFDFPLKADATFRSFFEYMKGGFGPDQVFDRFAFVDVATGGIKLKNGTKRYLMRNCGAPEGDAVRIMEIAKSFKGRIICWPEPPDNEVLRQTFNCLARNELLSAELDRLFGKLPSHSDGERQGGRPSLTSVVAEQYQATFSASNPPKSLAEAARVLGYDRKTVRKAIVEHGLTPVLARNDGK